MVTKLYLQEKYDPAFPQLTSWRLIEHTPDGPNVFWELSYREIRRSSKLVTKTQREFYKIFGDDNIPDILFTYNADTEATTISHIRTALRDMLVKLNRKLEQRAEETEAAKNMVWRPVEDMTLR